MSCGGVRCTLLPDDAHPGIPAPHSVPSLSACSAQPPTVDTVLARTHPSQLGRPRWVNGLDAVMAVGVALVAWWTVLYETVVATDLPTTPVVIGWLVTAPLVAAPLARAVVCRASGTAEVGGSDLVSGGKPRSEHIGAPKLLVAATVVGAAATAGLLATSAGGVFQAGVAVGVVTSALVMAWLRIRSRTARPQIPAGVVPAEPTPIGGRSAFARHSDLIVGIVACGLAVGSMFVLRISSDDVYYVNVSAWIGEHGHVPLRDTMFGPQILPSTYGGGFPIQSIEALIGAFAGLVGIRAGTVVYLLVAPLCAFASIWVLWQLALAWSRHSPLPAFGYSVAFVISGTGGAYRSYSIDGVWQGKSMAVAILMPLIWLYATRLARTRDPHWILMLALAGVAFVGLTSTGPLLGLMIASAIALAAVLSRNGALLVGAVALAVPPLMGGLAVLVLPGRVGGTEATAPAPWAALHAAYGAPPVLAGLTVAGVMLGPLFVRTTRGGRLIWCSAVLSLTVLMPGVLTLLNAATRSGPVDWRLLLSTPVPTVLGLFAASAARLARRAAARSAVQRLVAGVVAAGIVATFGLAGTPLWASTPKLSTRPAWKVDPVALTNVRALLATDPSRSGPMLLPPPEMGVLAVYTTRWFAVVPRELYLAGLDEPAQVTSDRRTLLRLVSPRPGSLTAADVGGALHRLDVTTVCLDASTGTAARAIRMVGYATFRPVGTLRCATWPGTTPAA